MSQVTETTTLRCSESIRSTETQDGAVLLDIRQGVCFSVNPVGALIWKQIGNGSSLAEIAQHLANTFSISCEQATVDVQGFAEQLKQRQLLRPEHEAIESKRFKRLRTLVSRLWNRSGRSAA